MMIDALNLLMYMFKFPQEISKDLLLKRRRFRTGVRSPYLIPSRSAAARWNGMPAGRAFELK